MRNYYHFRTGTIFVAANKKRTGLYWAILSLFVIIIDQFTKYLISQGMEYNTSFSVFPFLNLTLEHNTGAAFSFLSQSGTYASLLLVVTAVIVSLILCVWLYRLPFKKSWIGISLALILGGAMGNLIDRIAYGYVIDFIHFHFKGWSYPIFNVADIAITTGAIMLIIDIFKKKSA